MTIRNDSVKRGKRGARCWFCQARITRTPNSGWGRASIICQIHGMWCIYPFHLFSISFLFLTFVSIWPLERGERSQISCPLLAPLHEESMAISGNWFSCLFRFNTRYFRQDGGRSKLHFAASNASFKSFSCCIKPRSQLITFVKDSRKTPVFPFLPFF